MKGELTRDREISLERGMMQIKDFLIEDADRDWEAGWTVGGAPCCTRPGFEIHWVVDDMFQCVIISTRYRICGQGGTPRRALEDAAKQLIDFRDELTRYIAAV